jgi:hypothetical protein
VTVSVGGEATLNPTENLAPGSKHTATAKGGDAGAKDDEGTPLAGEFAWSFTTAGGDDTTPLPVPSVTLVNRLAHPGQGASNAVWIMIVAAFCIVLIGAGYTLARIALGQAVEGFDPELMLAVFATATGFLAGLLSPSPSGGR